MSKQGMNIGRRLFSGLPKYTRELKFIDPAKIEQIPTFRILNEEGKIENEMYEGSLLCMERGEKMVSIYKQMIKWHVMDQLMYEAQRQGRISFYLTSRGEEAIHFGTAAGLSQQDMIFAQYRESGALMYRGFGLDQFMNQLIGNKKDLGKGRQMPVHYGSKELNFQTISSPLGTQIPQAAGAGYRFKMEDEGKDRIAVCYFGEGAASEGDFHAGLNMASVLKTLTLFICRNNRYAISTHVCEQYAGDGIASRGLSYGMETIRVDGNDLIATYEATKEARNICIKKRIPVLVEAMTLRIGHHSTSDDSSAYRSQREIEREMEQSCPLKRLLLLMKARGWWSEREESDWRQECREQVLKELIEAEKSGRPEIRELFTDVYDEPPWNLIEQEAEIEKK